MRSMTGEGLSAQGTLIRRVARDTFSRKREKEWMRA